MLLDEVLYADSANALGPLSGCIGDRKMRRARRYIDSSCEKLWLTLAEPFEGTILVQESAYQPSGAVSGPMSQR